MDLDVSFTGGEINLAGTLALPDGNVKRLPAFVFVHRSGPTDRDENPDFTFLSPVARVKLAKTLTFRIHQSFARKAMRYV